MLPTTNEVATALIDLRDDVCQTCSCDIEQHDPECNTLLPVRLQVIEDDWTLNYGDPGWDTDHRGHWGSTTIAADDEDLTIDQAAQQLLNEIEESIAEAGDGGA